MQVIHRQICQVLENKKIEQPTAEESDPNTPCLRAAQARIRPQKHTKDSKSSTDVECLRKNQRSATGPAKSDSAEAHLIEKAAEVECKALVEVLRVWLDALPAQLEGAVLLAQKVRQEAVQGRLVS